jgi:rhamnulokinase
MLGTLQGKHIHIDELHRFATPLLQRSGHLFWDIEALWQEIRDGLERAAREAPALSSVSIDSWAVDYVAVNDAGEPLRNPYAYRDARTRGRLAQALRRVPAEDLYRRTGIQLLEINTLYQLLADLDEEPELLAGTTWRLPIADYLLYRLSGRRVVERTMASTTQLMDVYSGGWDMELLRRLGLPQTGWPEIVAPGTVLGELKGWTGTNTAPLIVASCSHDTAAAVAAVPADVNGPAWAYLSSGTWSLLGVERSAPILSDAARENNFTNEAGLDGTIRFLKNLTGLWVLQECEREWRTLNPLALLAEAAAQPTPAALLDLNDVRLAERGDMTARLLACCQDIGTPPPESKAGFVRLILESLAASYDAALRRLERVIDHRIAVLHVVGGGSQNDLLCELTAKACAIPVIAGPAEATALGNLLVQARTLGALPRGCTIRDVVRASSNTREYHPAKVEIA